ncbi:NAD(P)-binding protein [Whalleya microplaca]|nr:NAD(P)-binding protein [Whalleya microplaca]
MSTMSSGKKVFVLGLGFIGWNVLDLLVKENYEVTAYVRRKEHAEQLKASGASETVLGDLHDKSQITKHAASHDIIFHIATADDLPSVEAILDAVKQRSEKGLNTIYIHTSGTSVLDDNAQGQAKSDTVYHDSIASELDSVSDEAPHRQIDLTILKAKKQLGDKVKIAIVIPPLIYGFNPKHERLSIQIPTLTRYALKNGYSGHIGQGLSVWSTIHVLDLARGYLTILHHLESSPPNSPDLQNPYYFCENSGDNEVSWKEIALFIGAELSKAGLISDPTPRTIPPDDYNDLFGPENSGGVVGNNSRSRAVRLRALGWKPVEKSWKESYVQDELPAILRNYGS